VNQTNFILDYEVITIIIVLAATRGQLLRFHNEAHGKFTRKRQKEKITKIVWFYQGWALQMGAGLEKNIH
jgi:hypothetical protein